MSTALVSMLQKMETGYRIQDSGLFSTTRMDSAKWIQLNEMSTGFRVQEEMDSGFRWKWIQDSAKGFRNSAKGNVLRLRHCKYSESSSVRRAVILILCS